MRARWQDHAAAEGIDETEGAYVIAQAVLLRAARRAAAAERGPRTARTGGDVERERRAVALLDAAIAFDAAETAYHVKRQGRP